MWKIRQKSESQNECLKKTKHAKFSEKTNISYPLIRTRLRFVLLPYYRRLGGVNLTSNVTATCFWKEACKTLLPKTKDRCGSFFILRLKKTSWVCLNGSGIKSIFNWKAHLLVFFRSLMNSLTEAFTSWTTENKDVSGKSFTLEQNSFVHNYNSLLFITQKIRWNVQLTTRNTILLPFENKLLKQDFIESLRYIKKTSLTSNPLSNDL